MSFISLGVAALNLVFGRWLHHGFNVKLSLLFPGRTIRFQRTFLCWCLFGGIGSFRNISFFGRVVGHDLSWLGINLLRSTRGRWQLLLFRIAGFSFSTFNLGRSLLAILLSVGSELIRSLQGHCSSLLDVSFHHGALGSFLVGRGGRIVALGCSFLLRHVLLDLFLSFSSSVGDL